MSSPRVRPSYLRHGLGLLAVLLALAGRLATGPLVVDAQAIGNVAALLDAAIQCETMPGDSVPSPNPSRRHGSCHGIMALAADIQQASPTLTPAPVLPLPRFAILARVTLDAPGRRPVTVPSAAALPRGPPIPA